MQQTLQISFHGVERSDAIERRIREKAEELELFHDHIISCRVTVEAAHKSRHHGNLYSVHVHVHVPGKEIVAGRDRNLHHAHEDVYVAMRDAFAAAARQLEDHVRQQRGKVKRHEAPDHGTVSRLISNESHGFVRTADGTEVYFHENSVTGDGFKALQIGDEVRVVIAEGEGEQGPQASAVIPVGKHHVVSRLP